MENHLASTAAAAKLGADIGAQLPPSPAYFLVSLSPSWRTSSSFPNAAHSLDALGKSRSRGACPPPSHHRVVTCCRCCCCCRPWSWRARTLEGRATWWWCRAQGGRTPRKAPSWASTATPAPPWVWSSASSQTPPSPSTAMGTYLVTVLSQTSVDGVRVGKNEPETCFSSCCVQKFAEVSTKITAAAALPRNRLLAAVIRKDLSRDYKLVTGGM